MNYYYYFGASLPPLDMDSVPPLSLEEFVEECNAHLSENDLIAVKDLLVKPIPGGDSLNAFVDQWRVLETQLRNAIARTRAGRLGRSQSESQRGPKEFNASIETAVADAYTETNPLAREQSLDKFRWDVIEEMSAFDLFSIHAILAYTLKIQIANRWASMDEETGTASAEALINREPDAGNTAE